MGDFFKKKEEGAEEKDEREPITDFDELCTTYDFLVGKIQDTQDQTQDAIVSLRTSLRGDPGGRDSVGKINELRQRFQTEFYRIARLSIGINMMEVMRDIEELDRLTDQYSIYLERHIDALKFVCESAVKMIDERDKEVENLKIPKEDIEQPLTDERQKQLIQMYEACQTPFAFGDLINPKSARRKEYNITDSERKFLKIYNIGVQKFKGFKGKQQITSPKNTESNQKTQVFSPTTQGPSEQKPLLNVQNGTKTQKLDKKEEKGV